MKKIILSIAVLFSALTVSVAQQHPTRPPQGQTDIAPKGKVYGDKVDVKAAHPIGDLETYFGRRTSITTTISGKVIDVDRNGDYLTLRDNKGRPVTVRFANTGHTLPPNIKGRMILVDGVISKQFIADNHQPYAGANAGMDKTHQKNNNSGTYAMSARGIQLLN